MPSDSVTVTIDIAAPAEVVWHFLTLGRGTWWPGMVFEARVGSSLVETWLEEGRPAQAKGRIIRCDAPQTLEFHWREPGWSRPLDVSIVLTEKGASTAVALAESGFSGAHATPSLPAEHEEGWRYHLARLKRVSEGGTVEADST